MNKSKAIYPIVKLPTVLSRLHANDIPVEDSFEKPIRVDARFNKEEPGQGGLEFWLLVMLFDGAVLFFGAIPSAVTGSGDMAEAIPITLIVFVVSAVAIKYSINKGEMERQRYEAEKDVHHKAYEEYKKNLKVYEQELNEQTWRITLLDDDFGEMIYKSEILKRYCLSSVESPKEVSQEVLVGLEEKAFSEFLSQQFNSKIFNNLGISLWEYNQKTYVPDIVYYDSELGLCIDVEIDEEVEKFGGTRIHLPGNEHDVKRDDFFVENGWIVIRFTAKQVKEYPKMCVDFIKVTIERLGFNSFVDREYNDFSEMIEIRHS